MFERNVHSRVQSPCLSCTKSLLSGQKEQACDPAGHSQECQGPKSAPRSASEAEERFWWAPGSECPKSAPSQAAKHTSRSTHWGAFSAPGPLSTPERIDSVGCEGTVAIKIICVRKDIPKASN